MATKKTTKKVAKKTAKPAAKKTTAKKKTTKKKVEVVEDKRIRGCVPPNSRIATNSFGLFEQVEYVFGEDGLVDWKDMINPKHVVVNEDWFIRHQKDIPTSIEGLKDEQKIITLQGFKELAMLRGYNSLKFEIVNSSDTYCNMKCSIVWDANFETKNREVLHEEVANASVYNTDSFASVFLETIAANRAFSRCVRNFLKINIVGSEEVGSREAKKLKLNGEKQEEESEDGIVSKINIHDILVKSFEDKFQKNSFEDFLAFLRVAYQKDVYKNEQTSEWKSFEDISGKDCRQIMKVIKEWKLSK